MACILEICQDPAQDDRVHARIQGTIPGGERRPEQCGADLDEFLGADEMMRVSTARPRGFEGYVNRKSFKINPSA